MSYYGQPKSRNPIKTALFLIVLGILGGVGVFTALSVSGYFQGTSEPLDPIMPPGYEAVTPGGQAVVDPSIQDEAPGDQNASIGTRNFPELLIPSAELDQIIVTSYLKPEGWEINHLRERVGHLEGTSWVDQPGNVVLAGHVELSDGRLGAFGKVKNMEVGDDVTLRDGNLEYHYRVTEIKKVDATDLSVVYPTETPRLTLITCSDYNFFSNSYEKRLIVIAERVEVIPLGG